MSNFICPCCGRKYDIAQSGDYQCECGKEFHFELNKIKNGKSFLILLSVCSFISGLVIGGISVGMFFLCQQNKPVVPEPPKNVITSHTNKTVSNSIKSVPPVKSVSPAATVPAPAPQKKFQITHDYQIQFDDPSDRFEPDFQPYETNSAGYKVYAVKTNLKMDNRYRVYTDMQGNVLQTVLTIFTSSYNIPEALKNSLAQTILKDTTLKPVVSDGVLKIVDIPDLKNPENKREVSFATNETNLKITFSLHPLPGIKNPAGKPINGLFGISLGSADPKYPRDEKTFNPSLVFFTPNKKLPFNSDRRGNYYLNLDHAGKIISINASGKFFQKEWETVIRPTLKKNFEKLYNMTFTETSGGKYGKNGGSYYYVSGNRMLLLSWSWPDSYEVDFDVRVIDNLLLQNDEKWNAEKESRKMKKLQKSLSLDAENNEKRALKSPRRRRSPRQE